VLELNDQAYQHELKRAGDYAEQSRALLATNPDKQEFKQRAKKAEEYYKNEQKINSRLFVIDAGLDIQKLRAAYPTAPAMRSCMGSYIQPRCKRKTKQKYGKYQRAARRTYQRAAQLPAGV